MKKNEKKELKLLKYYVNGMKICCYGTMKWPYKVDG